MPGIRWAIRRWLCGLLLGGWLSLTHAGSYEGLQGLGEVHHERLAALDESAQPYHIFVRAPVSDPAEPDRRLPVVYLLDGGLSFPLLSGYYHYLHLSEELPELILVGISYGTDDWRQGNRRSQDYTLPSAEREHWGGAEDFDRWLEQRLLPWVESRYPADPERRILFGQSLGGQFVLFQAQFRPQRFWGLIASNPALHGNLEAFLVAAQPADTHPRLLLAAGSDDAERFAVPRNAWLAHWQGREAPFALEVRHLAGESHSSAMPAAFRAGLRWLFARDIHLGEQIPGYAACGQSEAD